MSSLWRVIYMSHVYVAILCLTELVDSTITLLPQIVDPQNVDPQNVGGSLRNMRAQKVWIRKLTFLASIQNSYYCSSTIPAAANPN